MPDGPHIGRLRLAYHMVKAATEDEALNSWDLRHIETEGDHLYYECPCGGKDHYASRAAVFDPEFDTHIGLSDFLHCYEHGKQWFINTDVIGIIAREEELYRRNLERFPDMDGRRVTAQEAFRLRTEQGCPVDMLEIDDIDEYERLWNEHRRKSGAKRRITEPDAGGKGKA